MTESKAPDVADLEDPNQLQRPKWLMPFLIAWIALVLAGYFAMTYAWDTTEPPAAPLPSTSTTTWSPECTAEDLDDGACHTYDDIRDAEWYSHTPSPTMQP
jgi:hypothetical protein